MSRDTDRVPDHFRRYYNDQKWWVEMQGRIRNKTQQQKILDRELMDAIDDPSDFEEIENLIFQGAELDHFEDGHNALQRVIEDDSDESVKVVCYLFECFPGILQKDTGPILDSPLSISIRHGFLAMSLAIVKTRHSKNPIYCYLRAKVHEGFEEQDMELLEDIDRYYNFSKVLKQDLRQIVREGQFNNPHVQRNLPDVFSYCKSKSSEFFAECFGKSYEIRNPITWRFPKRNKLCWVADELLSRHQTGKYRIRIDHVSIV